MSCFLCSKDFVRPPNGDWSSDREICDLCEREFCFDCGELEAYEFTFPNCCPGVYWCVICKTRYLEEAKGHLFVIANHDNHPDLLTYCSIDTTNGAFADRCNKCGMWA
jgi:hypothetical protein